MSLSEPTKMPPSSNNTSQQLHNVLIEVVKGESLGGGRSRKVKKEITLIAPPRLKHVIITISLDFFAFI